MQSDELALWVIAALLFLHLLQGQRPIMVAVEQTCRQSPEDEREADWWKKPRTEEDGDDGEG
jgi:hypothetical protein